MKKIITLLTAGLFTVLLFSGVVSAHVVVFPQETTQGSYEKFVVRVPSESDAATVKVEVIIPEEVEISRFEPKPDWEYGIGKDETGRIISVTWTATGAGLSATEFGEFSMQGKVAADATSIQWKAYQTYADGSVVDWIESAQGDHHGGDVAHPASVTKVNAAANEHTEHEGKSSNMPLYWAIAAFILGAVSLIISLLGRRKENRRRPE